MQPHFNLRLRSENRKQILLRALEDDPNDVQARTLLCFYCLTEGNHSDALAHVTRVLDLDRENPLALYILSDLVQKKDPQKSMELINRAIAADPSNPLFYGHLAHLQFLHCDFLRRRTKVTEALETSEKGLLIEPEDSYCLTMRALALFHLGRFEQAIRAFEESLAKCPTNKHVRRLLLLAYVVKFRFRKAGILLHDRHRNAGGHQ